METLKEKKEALYPIIDAYSSLLERQNSREYKERRNDLLARKKSLQRERYHIALIGYIKRGKSTLLNSLLGNPENPEISPVNLRTCTGAVIKYYDSALYPNLEGKEGAIVYFSTGENPLHIKTAEIPEYVDQTNKGYSRQKAEGIYCIDVYGPFPFIETRGVFVDTPGLGDINDQDNLSKGILPEADLILLPLSSDRFLDYDERVFLQSLPETEKKKLVFILTKIDELDRKEDLYRLVKETEEAAASITEGKAPVFKVSAKKVMDANQEGRSSIELKDVKKECGMEELENYLYKQLGCRSNAEQAIRILCKYLEGQFKADRDFWESAKEELKLKEAELAQRKSRQEIESREIKAKFEKNLKKLKTEWNRAVKIFIAKLRNKEMPISNRIGERQKSLVELIGYSSKIARKIEAELQRELEVDIMDLNDKLTEAVAAYNSELKADIEEVIELYSSYYTGGSLKQELQTLIGGGIALGTGIAGTTTAVGALTAILTAGGAAVEAGAAGGLAGILSKIFLGSAAAAKGAFFGALVGGIVPLLGGVAVAMLAYKLGTDFANIQSNKNMHDMVRKALEETAAQFERDANLAFENLQEQYQHYLDSLLEKYADELDALIKAKKDLNADALSQEMEQNLAELDKLSRDLIAFGNRIG